MSNNLHDKTDAEIVERVVSGDIDSYAEIVGRYEARLQRYFSYLIHNPTASKDIVQDTFIKAYQNLNSFNPKYKFSSWIYRIAHNEAMTAIKKSRHISEADINELPEAGYDQGLEKLIDAQLLKEHVQGCLWKLEPKYREVIQLVYFESMKYDQVSDILHLPTSTVGVRLLRAKAQLKEICTKRGVKR